MRHLAWLLALGMAGPAAAWQAMPPGDLAGITLLYDGAAQTFAADGGTVYTAGKPSNGHWWAEAGSYCSNWPPSDSWACYGLQRDGNKVRFIAADGSVTEGIINQPCRNRAIGTG